MKLSSTTLKFSTAYHPQTDGQTEVLNRGLEQYLRAFTSQRPVKWVAFLAWAELALNCTFHEGIRMSPFQALYGREPPNIFSTMAVTSKSPTVEELLRERADLLTDLKSNLAKMQNTMRQQANKHRRDVTFDVSALVLLKLQPYRQHSLARPISAKLSQRYYGPFEILERVGAVAYRLRLPIGCRIHDVFHVSMLKPFVASTQPPPVPTLPAHFFKDQPIVSPTAAVAARMVLVNGAPQEQWLVRWQDGPDNTETWESSALIRNRFPNLRLEDNAVPLLGDVDTSILPDATDDQDEMDEHQRQSRPRRNIVPPRRYKDYT